MMKEGQGRIAPERVVIKVTPQELSQLEQAAQERYTFQGYGDRKDRWGRGLSPNAGILGMVGEFAFVEWVNSILNTYQYRVDTTLNKRGDGGCDMTLFCMRYQIKCRSRYSLPLMLRSGNPDGTPVPLNFDYCIVSTYNIKQTKYEVSLDGWVNIGLIESKPSVTARVGSHLNKEIHNYELFPMDQLAKMLQDDWQMHNSQSVKDD